MTPQDRVETEKALRRRLLGTVYRTFTAATIKRPARSWLTTPATTACTRGWLCSAWPAACPSLWWRGAANSGGAVSTASGGATRREHPCSSSLKARGRFGTSAGNGQLPELAMCSPGQV